MEKVKMQCLQIIELKIFYKTYEKFTFQFEFHV